MNHLLRPISWFSYKVYCESAAIKEPSTGIQFNPITSYTLLGVGVRKVFYLNVYAIGLYVSNKALDEIISDSRWKQEFTSVKFQGAESNFFLSDLVSKDLKLVLETARNSDWTHLRNGLTKMVQKRYSSKEQNEMSDQEFQENVKIFKQMFPIGSFNAGTRVVFSNKNGLQIEMKNRQMSVDDPRFARLFFEAYLNSNSPSPTFLVSVAKGIEALLR